MVRTPRRLDENPTQVSQEWLSAHRDFHLALIGACGCEPMLMIANSLSLSTDLYRQWAAPSASAVRRDVEAEHRELIDAALARDPERSTELLRRHYLRTAEVLVESGLERTLWVEKVDSPISG